jgi:hypothetical protein
MNDNDISILIKAKDEASVQLKEIDSKVDSLSNSAERSGMSFGKMTAAVAAGQFVFNAASDAIGMLTGFVTSSIKAGEDYESTMAQINNELSNFGTNAPISASAAEDLATKLAETTTNSKDMALKAEEVILKFDRINKDTFPVAMQVTADLAARLGTDMPSAADTLGKALENPTRAVRALNEAGLAFTADQKKLLQEASNTGDVMKADNMILEALTENLKGASLASADTFAGKMKILNNDFDIFKEKVGDALLKALSPFVDKIMAWANDPATQAQIQGIVDKIAAMATAMANWVKDVAIPWIQQHWPQIKQAVKDAWDTMSNFATFCGNFAKALQNPAGLIAVVGLLYAGLMALNPVGGWVITITVLASTWQDSMNKIKQANDAMNGLPTSKKIQIWVEAVGDTARQLLPYLAAGMTGGVSLFLQKRAMGGSVEGGMPYLVGENGPEIIVPGQGGTVIPNNKIGASGTSITINMDNVKMDSQQRVSDLARELGSLIQRGIVNA